MDRKRKGVRAVSQSSIEITFVYEGKRCRERLKLKPSPANLKRAQRHKHAIEDAIERCTFDYSITFPDSARAIEFSEYSGDAIKVEKYLDGWIKSQKKHLKASTWYDYRKIINNIIIPNLGHLTIGKITRLEIKKMLSKLNAGNKRLSNIQSILRKALTDAIDDELIKNNPLFQWKYTIRDSSPRRDDIDPFSADEQAAIINALPDGANNLIQFAFWTGLRPSELIALNWDDVDWKDNIARISKSLTRAAKSPETTKTPAGIRDIKLLYPALDALEKQKQHTFLHPSGTIFIHPRTLERYSGDDAIRRLIWRPALKKAGVRYRNPYQTRHTYASMMLSAGEHPLWLARQMGHSDVSMIFRVYARWMPDANPDAGNKAVNLFSKNAGKNDGVLYPKQP